jgi:hypothetical protein
MSWHVSGVCQQGHQEHTDLPSQSWAILTAWQPAAQPITKQPLVAASGVHAVAILRQFVPLDLSVREHAKRRHCQLAFVVGMRPACRIIWWEPRI